MITPEQVARLEVGCRVLCEHPLTEDEFEVEITEFVGSDKAYFKGKLTKPSMFGERPIPEGSPWGGKCDEINEFLRPNWTPEMIEFAKGANRTYERHCQMYWDDLVGELSGRFGLDDDEAEELMTSQEAED